MAVGAFGIGHLVCLKSVPQGGKGIDEVGVQIAAPFFDQPLEFCFRLDQSAKIGGRVGDLRRKDELLRRDPEYEEFRPGGGGPTRHLPQSA